MNAVPANLARQRWGETLTAADNEPVTITSYGRIVAVLMEPGLARRALDALDDLEDLAAAEAACADVAAGGPIFSWRASQGHPASTWRVGRTASSWLRRRVRNFRRWTPRRRSLSGGSCACSR